MSDNPDPSKKKTRRRLRVSCVECTRRRQKCDRQQPCALCKSRGVEDLCRWELEPFARPAPARPPATAATPFYGQSGHRQPERSASHPPSFLIQGSAVDAVDSNITLGSPLLAYPQPVPPLKQNEDETNEAEVALAASRRNECLGTGPLICALYQLDDSEESRASSEQRTGTGTHTLTNGSSSPDIARSFIGSLRALVEGLPPRDVCDALLWGFFEGESWRYVLPQAHLLFMYDRLWEVLDRDSWGVETVDTVNVNWLTLLYAILATSPGYAAPPFALASAPAELPRDPVRTDEQERFFLHALSGRRIVEDMLYTASHHTSAPISVTEGAFYGCLAAVLLSTYMCDRGNVKGAWRILGDAVRCAQGIGLHRDRPSERGDEPQRQAHYVHSYGYDGNANYHTSNEERDLWRATWWLITVSDRLLSFVLEKSALLNRAFDTNVPLPKFVSGSPALDGTTDTNMTYQACMVQLSEIITETGEKCSNLHPTPYAAVISMDRKFDDWDSGLPQILSTRTPDISYDHIYPKLPIQRWTLAIHYLAARMRLHRPFIQSRPPVLPPPHGCSYIELNPSRSKCILLALDLLRAERAIRPFLAPLGRGRVAGAQPAFANTFFVFDGAATLCIALIQNPDDTCAPEWREEVDLALEVLEEEQAGDGGDVIEQALRVIGALCKAAQRRAEGPRYEQGRGGVHAMRTGTYPWTRVPTGKPHIHSPSSPFPIWGTSLSNDAVVDRMVKGLGDGMTAFELLHALDSRRGVAWQGAGV